MIVLFRSVKRKSREFHRGGESASNRYEFFFDKVFTDKNRTYYEKKYPGVTIVKFQDLNVMKV